MPFLIKFKKDFSAYYLPVLFLASFFLWAYSLGGFFSGRLAMTYDAVSYYEHVRYYLDNISRGVYPFWDPTRDLGVPNTFFLRRFGEFNPLWLFVLVLHKIGMVYRQSYLAIVAFYYLIGMVGFFLLSQRLFQDNRLAFLSYLLMLYSPAGTRLFDSYLHLIFVPMVWFFYFLVSLKDQLSLWPGIKEEEDIPKKKSLSSGIRFHLLGLTFSFMIILITYIPFYFLTILAVFLMCYSGIYFPQLRHFILCFGSFLRSNKFFSFLCLGLIIFALIPGIMFYLESAKGEMVLPLRHEGSSLDNMLGVDIANINRGGVTSFELSESMFSFRRKDENLPGSLIGKFYVPIFAVIILLLGLSCRLNRKILLLSGWAFIIFLISLTDACAFYEVLYNHIFLF